MLEYNIVEGWVDCICPGCKAEHKLKLIWAGKIPANKFCHACNGKADRHSSSFINLSSGYKLSTHKPAE